jgi:hypothetical protein
MPEIVDKIRRIADMATEVHREIEGGARHERLGRRQHPATATFCEQQEVETILQEMHNVFQTMEGIRNSLKRTQASIVAAKSQSQSQKRPRRAQDHQQRAPARCAQLRPKLSMSQQAPIYQGDMEPDSPTTTSSLSDLDTDDFSQVHRNSTPTSDSETTQYLRVEQMGDKLVESLAGLIESDSFSGKLTVQDLGHVDWADVIFDDPEKHEQWAVKYKPTSIAPRCASLTRSNVTEFRRPRLSTPIQWPSDKEVLDFLEQAATDPPKKDLQYYVGPRLTTAYSNLLHSGPVLSAISSMEGVNSAFDHIGERWSGTAFHREDAHFRSSNLTLSGVKVWIIIRQHHTQRFEDYVRTFATGATCDQFVRHQGLLFAPSELRSQDIEFDIHCAKPGDLIITKPGQYHAVVNFTDCYAIATNFLLHNEKPFPLSLQVCSRCGLRNLYEQGKLKYAETLLEIQKCTDEILEQDPQCSIPKIDPCNPPSVKVFRLAAVIRSRAVISQFIKIVEAIRDGDHVNRLTKQSSNPEDRILLHMKNLSRSEQKSDLLAVRRRYDQILLVRDIEASMKGQLRLDSHFLTELCERADWSPSTYRRHREQGMAWKIISEAFDGLIYFIPTGTIPTPAKATLKEYVGMTGNTSELEKFKKLLNDDHTAKLCAAGKTFQQSYMGSSLPKFKWEAAKIHQASSLSMSELLSFISPVAGADDVDGI